MPPEGDMVASQAAGNNSSDFVRKLYKMLEDPTYYSVVRWSADGDSFVVLENEKFTKTILPKHFKHSNFASFVRQLNKYDFHKVRHNEESGENTYGRDAWEFRHPEFRADRKDNLDNIRRKPPAPRKPPPTDDLFPPAQQLVALSESLAASQHQIQALQEQYFELAHTNKVLVDQVVNLQKMVRAQGQVSNELITHLNNMEDRRRNSRHSAQSSHSNSGATFSSGTLGLLPDGTDEPAPELRRAREILSALSPDSQGDRELEKLFVAYHQNGSPAESASSSMMFAQTGSGPIPLIHDPINDPRHMVYPVGQTQGIDPFHSDHIHNIPYSRPLSNPSAMAEAAQITPPLKGGSIWGPKKPRILLVEDDKTCARVGMKFLTSIDCNVETARDGLEGVENINREPDRFDLIFMDIIMPNLDGVSATAMIRMVAPRVPIIAMTSNIRQEDIQTYFSYGMNDVLAKPFTRDGMVRVLRKQLSYLLREPTQGGSGHEDTGQGVGAPGPGPPSASNQGGYAPAGAMSGPMGNTQIKFEQTPIQSPSTTASWHSPGGMGGHASPSMDGSGGYMGGGGSGMVMGPGGGQRGGGGYGGQQGGQQQVVGGMDERPEKRARLYGPGGGGPGQTGYVQ